MATIPMILVGSADDYRGKAAKSFGYGVFFGFLALFTLAVALGAYIKGDYLLMTIPGFIAILMAIMCAILMQQYMDAKLVHKQILNTKSVEATAAGLIAVVNTLESSPGDRSKEE